MKELLILIGETAAIFGVILLGTAVTIFGVVLVISYIGPVIGV
jgi:hypothetical protein